MSATTESTGQPLVTLPTGIQLLAPVPADAIDLLSVDTEGCEWFVLQTLRSRPAVISIETHGGLYLNPHRDEIEIAKQIRARSAIAQPNRLIVSLADKALGREGRMLRALDEMGPGSMMVEGRPFRIDLD